MRVVHVRRVRVAVPCRRMPVRMAVRSRGHGIVRMVVVAVVMAVRMLVFQRIVRVRVRM